MELLINRKLLFGLTVPLAGLMVLASAIGMLHPEIYSGSTPVWFTQTVGQDAIDLILIVPVLLISAIYYRHGSDLALHMWTAANIYVIYTFLIYCFDVRFNSLFVVYCLILGLSSYSVGILLYKTIEARLAVQVASSLSRRVVGYFMIALAIAFCALWLSEIVPAIVSGAVPDGVRSAGLLTNPVHVIDLSIVLPLVFITGVLVLRQNSFALNLAPAILLFFVLMDITIATLALLLYQRGLESDYTVVIVMGVHAALSVGAVVLLVNKTTTLNSSVYDRKVC